MLATKPHAIVIPNVDGFIRAKRKTLKNTRDNKQATFTSAY